MFLWDGGPPSHASPDTEIATLGDFGGGTANPAGRSVHFPICGDGPRITCVVDGDTIWLDGTKIRIADINTPEVSSPDCAYEARLGRQATMRLQQLLNAGPVELHSIDRDEDRYGRKLRIITRGGASLGEELVAEGLAERWRGQRSSWC